MLVYLKNALVNQHDHICINEGDKAKLCQIGGNPVVGTVTRVTDETISLRNAEILPESMPGTVIPVDVEEVTFQLEDLEMLQAASFQQLTPLTLIAQVRQCDNWEDEAIVMSPLFYNWYQSHIQNLHPWTLLSYSPIFTIVNPSLVGMSLYASARHKYCVTFYINRKWRGSFSFRCTELELERELQEVITNFEKGYFLKEIPYTYVLKQNEVVIKEWANDIYKSPRQPIAPTQEHIYLLEKYDCDPKKFKLVSLLTIGQGDEILGQADWLIPEWVACNAHSVQYHANNVIVVYDMEGKEIVTNYINNTGQYIIPVGDYSTFASFLDKLRD